MLLKYNTLNIDFAVYHPGPIKNIRPCSKNVYLCLEPQVAQPSSLSLEESLDCFTGTAEPPFRDMMSTSDVDWIISEGETGPGSSAMPSDAA